MSGAAKNPADNSPSAPVRFRAGGVSTRIERPSPRARPERIIRFFLHSGQSVEVSMTPALGDYLAKAIQLDGSAKVGRCKGAKVPEIENPKSAIQNPK